MNRVHQTLIKLDAWLETMRNERGYTGPISHWWESSLLYTGYMIDWRYEGILDGYVTLFEKTRNPIWLERATRAAEDCQNALMPNGNYRNSAFQQGPIEGGTPHEVAVDVGLLSLARLLRKEGDERWERYFRVAQTNLKKYILERLWNGKGFLDQPWNKTLVPNKNATTIDALLLYHELSGESVDQYIDAAAQVILGAQIKSNDDRDGGVIHLGTGKQRLSIGIYTARSCAALFNLYQHRQDPRYLEAAKRMGAFLVRLISQEGTYFGYYPDGRLIVSPAWISPSGDCLRALNNLREHLDIDFAVNNLTNLLYSYQHTSGGIYTSQRLNQKGGTNPQIGLPDFRDVLPVVGWSDKAFRALGHMVQPEAELNPDPGILEDSSISCMWKGRQCIYEESKDYLKLKDIRNNTVIYYWEKGAAYAQVYKL